MPPLLTTNISSRVIITLLGLFLSLQIYGQNEIFEVDHITIEDGFPVRFCRQIAVDNLGQIWTSSKNELLKYNGFDFERYDYSNSVLTKGIIVGLHYYKDELYVFQLDYKKDANLSYPKINVFIFDFKKNIPIDFKERFTESEVEYVKYFCERNGRLIVVDQSNRMMDLVEQKQISESTLPSSINIIGLNKSSQILFIKDGSLVMLDLNTGSSDILISDFYNYYSGWDTDDFGNIFLRIYGTDRFNLEKYHHYNLYNYPEGSKVDLKELELQYFTQSENIKNQNEFSVEKLISQKPNDLFLKIGMQTLKIIDYAIKDDIAYAATDNGLLIIRPTKTSFKVFAYDDHQLNATRKGIFSEDLLLYKANEEEVIVSPSGKYDTNFISEDQKFNGVITYYQERDNSHKIWSTGWIKYGLRLIDFKKQEVVFPVEGKFENIHLIGMAQSDDSQKIFTHSNNQLFFIEEENLKEDLNWKGYTNDSVVEIVNIFSGVENIWIGTLNGLLSYNVGSGEIYRDPIFDEFPNVGVACMHIDKTNKDIIWVGTKHEGLLKWNTVNGTIKRYGIEDGLENQSIHSIFEDKLNRLWFPTNKYLHCFDKTQNRFFVFSEEDGVSNNEFNLYGFSENKSQSEIILASLNGYTMFNPDSISTGEKQVHKINLLYGNEINKQNQEQILSADVLREKSIHLDSDKSSLELGFGLNPTINSDLNSFYFRLNSQNGKWNKMNSNKINLFTLPYGNNVLEVQANVNQPKNISDILSINVHVQKPFHKTNWFWILSTFILLGLGWAFIILRLRVIQRRNKKLELEIDNRTRDLQEANTKRQKLFTILSHDLRAPISSLSNITKKLRFLEKNNRMDEFHDLALDTESRLNALNDNLSNILFWASKETNELQILKTKIDIHSELVLLIELYASDAQDLGVDIVNYVQKETEINFDKAVFQTVLRNAIQNAVKYSATNKPIEISCKSINTHLIVTVKNVHNQEEQINKIHSTGMGLKITEELAELANSKIELKANVAGKTYFNFYMPK